MVINKFSKYLQILTEYAINEGFSNIVIKPHIESSMCWKSETLNEPFEIFVEEKRDTETSVYLFLHELGHYEVRKYWDKFENSLPLISTTEELYITNKNNRKTTKSIEYQVSSLEEEYLAWNEGFNLAKRLNLLINLKKFNKVKSKYIMTYIKYFASFHQ